MATETLYIPEEYLEEVVRVIRTGLEKVEESGNLISEEAEEAIVAWCDEMEEYLAWCDEMEEYVGNTEDDDD